MQTCVDPKYFIVDIRDVLRDYSVRPQFFKVYRHFPLQEIVQCVLSVNAYGDNGEFFWHELENRFDRSGSEEVLDYDILALFHELLCNYLDEYIRLKVPANIDTGEYVFHRWVSNTAVMLQKDDNARSCNRLM